MLYTSNLYKSFDAKQILNGINMTVEMGKIYALMGTNGSGKTTLFNIITGFLNVDSGKVHFNNAEITNTQPFRINRLGIGRTFQDLRLISKLSVKQNIVLAMQQNPTDNWLNAMLPENFHCNTNTALEKKADEIIKQFFLSDVQHSLAAEISYGQQKLLSLACCVANGAELLLLDEPVAGINPEYRNKIKDLILHLKMEGKTILLIEHNSEFIEQLSDRLFFLSNGALMEFENYSGLKNNPAVQEAYL